VAGKGGEPPSVAQLTPAEAWARAQADEVEILDLRTRAERRRYGAPPGARKVSLLLHMLAPRGRDAVYLCQHANRSKLTGRRGAPEIAGGWAAWRAADLPVEGAD
jgi:rhodanese-related sulfurtransferase